MLNLFKSAMALAFLSTLLYAQQPKEVSKNELQEIKSLPILQKANIDVKKAFDIGNLFILDGSFQGKPQELFLTKDKQILIAGNVTDFKHLLDK